MRRLAAGALGCVLASAAAWTDAAASQARSWTDRTREAFQEGALEGVSVTGRGHVVLAPEVQVLIGPSHREIWSLATDAAGRVYAGGGHGANVYRYDPAADSVELILRAGEMQVQAVAVHGEAVYAATGPEGKIYRIEPEAEPAVHFDPPDPYIWDLVVDRDGRLYVATGNRGILYRVEPNGEGAVLYDGPEAHVRCLGFDGSGRLLAGTAGRGYLYRFDAQGDPFVLFAPEEVEIVDLVVGGAGRIYVAALGTGGVPKGAPQERSRPDDRPPAGERAPSRAPERKGDERTARQVPPAGGRAASTVYEVSPEGHGRSLFSSPLAVLSLALDRSGRLLAGTGDDGLILLLSDDGPETRLVRPEASQITALVAGPDGSVYGGTANPGTVFALTSGVAPRGSFVSAVKDAGRLAHWGRIAWEAEVPKSARLELAVRTGNTEEPDDTWSAWSGPLDDGSRSRIDRPPARFLQYRALLESGRDGQGPILRSVQVFYLEENVTPEVRTVETLAPGVVLLNLPSQQPDQEAVARAEAENQAGGTTAGARPRSGRRKTFREGMRTLVWTAEDPNQDQLVFDVEYRSGAGDWKPLASDLEERHLSFDTRQFPDGTYWLRVVASDSPSNPADRALRGHRMSEPLDIDNTPPEVQPARVDDVATGLELTFTVTDAFTPVAEVRYSLDAGGWAPVLPEDGVPDSLEESFRIRLEGLAPGEHSVVVQARDGVGNLGSGRLSFTSR